jgi:hypothetical protein
MRRSGTGPVAATPGQLDKNKLPKKYHKTIWWIYEIFFLLNLWWPALPSNPILNSVYVWQIQNVTWYFQAQNHVNWHLHFILKFHLHFKLISSTCHSFFFFFKWRVLFLHKLYYVSNCVCQLTCIIWCQFWVSNVKTLQKVCQKYTQILSAPHLLDPKSNI